MASSLYDRGRQGFLSKELDWVNDLIKMGLIDHTDDTPSIANDEDWADRATAARIVTPVALAATKTAVDGVADAGDTTWSSASGDAGDSIDIYYDSTVEATSLMICNIDTATGGTLPVTPNGGDITVAWDNGADKIFKL